MLEFFKMAFTALFALAIAASIGEVVQFIIDEVKELEQDNED
ncbi:hypothetical protein lacNasYZ03_11460 [Lactobacillus nasalidis]|uniref:Holin n=1 Tax=Lactobacillus nasalidis TaxID=2797258 RepID=A0ABQ3W6U4_9LACO|nr:hypothetical protein [Lactobacillus nasalidis]GHV97870.1 hypothetical protein lacNasYZ01_10520 [Lactobacillus nasalidis]GHW00100.1 hypothetical protein lacNasYZ02_15290 [Lactobacillus nasalidis]GHW01459.1 hypothetical protein lacNasYZ03_11460 [Lactobacillus nasalidis]